MCDCHSPDYAEVVNNQIDVSDVVTYFNGRNQYEYEDDEDYDNDYWENKWCQLYY